MSLKVVYVDDEIELCVLFKELFESPEILISTFSDPFEALKYLKEEPADIVFLDYRMPGLNGIELAQQMDASIPKCLITGEVQLAEHPAIKMVLRKPYAQSKVREILDSQLLGRSEVAS